MSRVPPRSLISGRKPRISWLPAPRPVPNSNRPPERWSSMATFSATLAGWFTCGSGLKIPEPRWIRSVECARYPRNTSLAERCEYSSRKWCSVTHTYLKPAWSAAFTSSSSFINAWCSASGSFSRRNCGVYPCTKIPNSITSPRTRRPDLTPCQVPRPPNLSGPGRSPCGSGVGAAVDAQRRPGDEAAVVGREHGDDRRHDVGWREAVGDDRRHLGEEAPVGVAREHAGRGLGDAALDAPRRDGRHPDAALAVLDGERVRHGVDAALARGIRRHVRVTERSRGRAEVHDRRVLRLEQRRDGGPADEERPGEVDADHLVPRGERALVGVGGAEDARRVHQHVETAEAVDGGAHAGLDGLLVGDVEHRRGEALADAVGVGQLGGPRQPRFVDVD